MLLEARHLSRSFGAVIVLGDCSLTLNAAERVGLVGANGAGKSTLLRLLAGADQASAGSVLRAPGVEIGHLAQSNAELPDATVDATIRGAVAHLLRMGERLRALEARMAAPDQTDLGATLDEYGSMLARFQDRGGFELEHRIAEVLAGLGLDQLPRDRRIETLSGGERARLGLAGLLLSAPDVLLLDEPTNYVSLDVLDAFEAAVLSFPGPVLAASHDRWFIQRFGGQVWQLCDGRLSIHEAGSAVRLDATQPAADVS